MIEAFKDDLNKSLKKIQDNTFKQVETLKDKANKYKKIQKYIFKQVKDMEKRLFKT